MHKKLSREDYLNALACEAHLWDGVTNFHPESLPHWGITMGGAATVRCRLSKPSPVRITTRLAHRQGDNTMNEETFTVKEGAAIDAAFDALIRRAEVYRDYARKEEELGRQEDAWAWVDKALALESAAEAVLDAIKV